MPADRRYDDREVRLILARVAELHENEGDNADARAMTRAELRRAFAAIVTLAEDVKALPAGPQSDGSHDDPDRP